MVYMERVIESDGIRRRYDMHCNIAQTLNLIGDRWTLLILHTVCEGRRTYKDLQGGLEGMPTNLLSSRLKSLCEDKLLSCSLYQEHPLRYQYELTDKSRDLDDIYNVMMIQGDRHLHKSYKRLKRKYCGGAVDIQYVYRECGKVIRKEDLIAKPVKR